MTQSNPTRTTRAKTLPLMLGLALASLFATLSVGASNVAGMSLDGYCAEDDDLEKAPAVVSQPVPDPATEALSCSEPMAVP